jgi:hypothetical protein
MAVVVSNPPCVVEAPLQAPVLIVLNVFLPTTIVAEASAVEEEVEVVTEEEMLVSTAI